MRYQCQRCGNCCRWPGDTWIKDWEVGTISRFLGITEKDFLARYTRLTANRQGLSLVEKEENRECIFLDGIDCLIQPAKPTQCSGFPNDWNFPGWREECEATEVVEED